MPFYAEKLSNMRTLFKYMRQSHGHIKLSCLFCEVDFDSVKQQRCIVVREKMQHGCSCQKDMQ